MKKFITIITVLALMLCLSGSALAASEPAEEFPYRIAMVSKVSNTYMDVLHVGANEMAEELGITDNFYLCWCDTGTSIEQQIQIMEDIITQGYDAIVLLPLSSEVSTVAAKAMNEGIKVINGDNLLDAEVLNSQGIEDIPVFIGADNFTSAYNVGKAVAEEMGGEGEVAILGSEPSNIIGVQRTDGFKAAFAEYPDIKIVAEQNANGNAEDGLEATQGILIANPGLKAIVGMNDECVLGAYEAVRAAGYNDGEIIIGGIDADLQMLQYIEQGKTFCTIYQNQDAQGARMVEACYNVLMGLEEFESAEIVYVPTILVTPDNVAEYLPE